MPKLLPQITATDKFIQRVSKGRVTILDLAAGTVHSTLMLGNGPTGIGAARAR